MLYSRILFAVFWCLCGSLAFGQEFTIHALDGRNGQPIKGEHLVVFVGQDSENPRSHSASFDLKTDENGVTVLHFDGPADSFVQVWVDFHTQCLAHPNLAEYSVIRILNSGIVEENKCGKVTSEVRPKTLTIYARPPHWWEALRW
jgi:hypothetical protein